MRCVPSVFLLAVSAALAGCATPGQVAQNVVRSNLGQEQAHNSLLLLNVVRAYQRKPMHFTRVKSVRLPLGIGNPTVTIPTPWGPDFTSQIYNVSTQLGLAQSVDSEVMDSQEFMRGVMTPVTSTTLLYYLEQGWPQQLILHMFVRAIEVHAPCKPNAPKRPGSDVGCVGDRLIQRVEGYPQNRTGYRRFQTVLEGLLGCEIDPGEDIASVAIGPIFTPDRIGDAAALSALAAARKESLEFLPVDALGEPTKSKAPYGYRLFKLSKAARLKFNLASSPTSDPCRRPEVTALEPLSPDVPPPPDPPGMDSVDLDKKYAVFVLRSPEAMLYHLGELARAQLGEPGAELSTPTHDAPTIRYRAPRANVHGRSATLFQLRRGQDDPAALSVEYEGQVFSVPKPSPGDRSMHVLSLLTQLLSLHNKSSDAPATTNVRVVP